MLYSPQGFAYLSRLKLISYDIKLVNYFGNTKMIDRILDPIAVLSTPHHLKSATEITYLRNQARRYC
jgi:hypothetical protein